MNLQAHANNNAVPDAPETAFPLFNQPPLVYTNFLARALPLAGLGLEVFPIDPRGKEPLALGFLNKKGKPARLAFSEHATSNRQMIEIKWGGPEHADCNVGVCFKDANYGVDIDNLTECEKILGTPLDTQGARVNTSTPNKLHLYFDGVLPDWFWSRGASYVLDGKDRELFSVRCNDRYLVGPGSVHPDGPIYQWAKGRPDSLPATNENLLRQLQEIAEKRGAVKPSTERDGALWPEERL